MKWTGQGRTELDKGPIPAGRDRFERGVRLAVSPARPRPSHVRRAYRGARVVCVYGRNVARPGLTLAGS